MPHLITGFLLGSVCLSSFSETSVHMTSRGRLGCSVPILSLKRKLVYRPPWGHMIDLISTLLLGLGLSFWDINSTDIGDGQPYGLSPPPYLSATSAPVTRPSPIWFSVSGDSTESPTESFGVETSGITFATLGYL